MGGSDLQSWIVDIIVRFLHKFLDYKNINCFTIK